MSRGEPMIKSANAERTETEKLIAPRRKHLTLVRGTEIPDEIRIITCAHCAHWSIFRFPPQGAPKKTR